MAFEGIQLQVGLKGNPEEPPFWGPTILAYVHINAGELEKQSNVTIVCMCVTR